MEKNVEKVSKAVDLAEKDLLTSVALKDPTYTGLDLQLAKFRDACSAFIFLNWHAAILKNVEVRLWDAHSRVNSKFRPYLARFREGNGKKKHVERRKAEKLYLDFIKSSMRFYRGFVQRLASRFDGVPEVFDIARRFNLDTLAADEPVSVDLTMKHLILQSCHATLIHLGDLSRYRETELNQQQRNWGPAKGYYELAVALDPADGTSFNQLAVISLADNDHLRAVYYLYRALCIQKPAPQTLGNLEVEFKKVLRHHKRGETLLPPEAKNASKLVSSFLAYHAACYMAPDSSDFEGQRAALIVEFEKELRTKPFDSSFRKMCIINIAAVQHARVREAELSESDPEGTLKLTTSVKEAHDLNVGISTTLFALLAAALRHGDQEQEQVSPLVRRLLPLLRLYSAWLLSNTSVLEDTKLPGPQPLKLWAVYAEALSLLVSSFPIQELPNVPYLLEEDQDVISFSAFSDLVRKFHFYDSNGSLKPSRSDAGVSTSTRPDQEMLFRIKKLVVVGLHLSTEKTTPLIFGSGMFQCVDPGAGSQSSDPTSDSDQPTTDADMGVDSVESTHAHVNDAGPAPSALENMVNELVESKPYRSRTSSHSQPSSPNTRVTSKLPLSRPTSSALSAHDLVRQMQQPSPTTVQPPLGRASHRISLPSIVPSPFTPRPGETDGTSPRPETPYQTIPPSTAPVPPSRGAFEFQQQIAQMKHDIQARTSPITAFEPAPSLPSYYETPTGLNTFVRNQPDSSPSPWERSLTTPAASGSSTELPRKAPQASPFGAIGERPRSAKTSTGGQPG